MSKEKITADGVKFVKDDFTANVVESTKEVNGETKTVKQLDLTANPERVEAEFKNNLPEGLTIQTVKDVAAFSKAFLESTAVQSAHIAVDAFNDDKSIDKVNVHYSHVGGNARNEINATFDRSKSFLNIKDPSNPIVGPGVTIGVKDVATLVTGNTKTKIKDFLKENINA